MSNRSVLPGVAPSYRALPPRTRGLPLVGALPAFLRQPFDFLLDARARYGDIYTLDLGLTHVVVLNHPRHAEHIFVDNVQNYGKRSGIWDAVRTLLGNGLLVSEGDVWLRQRRLLQPHFHRKQLAGLTDAMVAATAESLASWEQAVAMRQPLDVRPSLAAITMRVITRALFGQGLGSVELERVSQRMAFVIDYLLLGMITGGLPRWFPIPGARRYQRALRAIDGVVLRIIAQERAAAAASTSLLGTLVRLVDAETGAGMTDAQLRDEVQTFFLAGYETTSLALAWTIQLLIEHPDVLHTAQSEVDAVLGARAPTFADLESLGYIRAVVQESMRLRPPSWFSPRTALADDLIDGYAIPAGTTVVSLTFGIHHNPTVWDDPERFDPERFLGSHDDQRHKLAWIPFGAGQRQCIGRDFAMMEAQIILAMLLQRYTLAAAGPSTAPKLSLTLKPGGAVSVRLTQRRA